VEIDARAKELVARERVDVRMYEIIYEAIEDVRAAMEGLLKPDRAPRGRNARPWSSGRFSSLPNCRRKGW
jgi:translation initiation factor IF-2